MWSLCGESTNCNNSLNSIMSTVSVISGLISLGKWFSTIHHCFQDLLQLLQHSYYYVLILRLESFPSCFSPLLFSETGWASISLLGVFLMLSLDIANLHSQSHPCFTSMCVKVQMSCKSSSS